MRSERFRIQNPGEGPLDIILEPWGRQLTLSPLAEGEVVATGPDGGCLEIVERLGRVTIYGWPGSTVTVMLDGKEQMPEPHPAFEIPPGRSMREMMRTLLGTD